MEHKEIEQKLQKSAEEIKVRDFSLVWEEIKDKEPKVEPKKIPLSRWMPAVAAAACVVLSCSIVLPIALGYFSPDSAKEIYHGEELKYEKIDVEDIYEQLTEANIEYVDLTRYEATQGFIRKTTNNVVKGAKIDFADLSVPPAYMLSLQLYTEDVQIDDPKEYDVNYTVNGAVIEYAVKDADVENSVYVYDIYANYKDVNYFMEYTCYEEDVKPFLNEFFQ